MQRYATLSNTMQHSRERCCTKCSTCEMCGWSIIAYQDRQNHWGLTSQSACLRTHKIASQIGIACFPMDCSLYRLLIYTPIFACRASQGEIVQSAICLTNSLSCVRVSHKTMFQADNIGLSWPTYVVHSHQNTHWNKLRWDRFVASSQDLDLAFVQFVVQDARRGQQSLQLLWAFGFWCDAKMWPKVKYQANRSTTATALLWNSRLHFPLWQIWGSQILRGPLLRKRRLCSLAAVVVISWAKQRHLSVLTCM